MPESSPLSKLPQPNRPETEKKEKIIENVVFTSLINTRTGQGEYKSSAPDRKIMLLSESSLRPNPGEKYKVRVLADTKPEDPMSGKMVVEIYIPPEEQNKRLQSLAQEAKQAFSSNDLDIALQKLQELQKESRQVRGEQSGQPEPPEEGRRAEILANQEQEAKEILQENYLGPEAIEKAFGIRLNPENIPPILFTKEELERAKELGQSLILRMDKAPDGQPLTMQKMQELLQPQFTSEAKGKILDNTDWYQNEDFFTKETPKLHWALASR